MNKLILIGNGFDLAHGLKTKYSDFILWYLNKSFHKTLSSNYHEDGLIKIYKQYGGVLNSFNTFKGYHELLSRSGIKVEYKHNFLKSIVEESVEYNWVDIEYKYYSFLITLYKRLEKGNVDKHKTIDDELIKLNQSFDLIKEQLEIYLSTIKIDKKNEEIDRHLKLLLKNIINKESNSWFLNFNYTNTIELYLKQITSDHLKVINIHGSLNDKNNPIIFGYGDERDTYYSKIERLNNNDFLKNIKSFGYFMTRNYQDLSRFVESGLFEVHVMGHSCGISDRILLNSIFENQNCSRIKIFYYQKNIIENDFFEKTQEISRHFSPDAKGSMRKKIMPFCDCVSLVKFKS